MELYRWDPFTALARLDREFDGIVRRTWGTGNRAAATSAMAAGAGFVPAVEMAQDGPDVLIRLELPGIDPTSDVDVSIHEGRLIVQGERKDARSEERGKTFVRELRYGSFRREFALPDGVTFEDVDASYEQGLLELRIRNVVKPPAEPKRVQVAVRGAAAPRQVEGELASETTS